MSLKRPVSARKTPRVNKHDILLDKLLSCKGRSHGWNLISIGRLYGMGMYIVVLPDYIKNSRNTDDVFCISLMSFPTEYHRGLCGVCAASVRRLCGACAAPVRRLCGVCAAPVRRLCGVCAASVRRLCAS